MFWAFYTLKRNLLDRNLCVIIGRPFTIPDEAIHTPLRELSEGVGGSRAPALHLIKHRRLESEMLETRNRHRTARRSTSLLGGTA
ncbi:uncharacterized protein GLRG_10814 [Colletotrichum graminicola M1.001]|uniref:Uncharacterized protein n=1 Tax=Colletotrichum graminicola (strain M1.001 / M2 / FGSC 10212) TaxID=645133 RepID=E3QXR7_COLGM|nr:uncharacterized protein GLRG_10814 [Colletotrichum graminicola M1.001]EFQ35670.1 hypothetical protein GLRG_10814 [Colletotrichum graminicola M1.001]